MPKWNDRSIADEYRQEATPRKDQICAECRRIIPAGQKSHKKTIKKFHPGLYGRPTVYNAYCCNICLGIQNEKDADFYPINGSELTL